MDTTTLVVALAGIAATLVAALAGPLVVERVHRESERRSRLFDRRLDVYADLLRVTSQVVDNAEIWATYPLADLKENDAAELDRLVPQARVVASKAVYDQLNDFTRRSGDFYRLLFDAKADHQLADAEGKVEGTQDVQQRMTLAEIADDLSARYRKIEVAVRSEVGP